MSDFAKKMMAKMGHVEGQGLGKDGTGIAAPIEAAGNVGQSGLGYAELYRPAADALPVGAPDPDDFTTTVVRVDIVNNEPIHVQKLFCHTGAIKDILSGKDNTAYVLFDNADDAEAALSLDGQVQHLGPKISVTLVREEDVPQDPWKRLSDALAKRNACGKTRTVRVSGLNWEHPERALNRLFKEDMDFANEYEEAKFYQHVDVVGVGEVLVRFSDQSDAQHVINSYDCEVQGGTVVNIECVADTEMDGVMAQKEEKKTNGPSTGLWVGGLNKPGQDEAYIRDLFHPIHLHDVTKNVGQPFAFVFMGSEDAEAWMARRPTGTKFRGSWHKINPIQKGGKKGKGRPVAPPAPAPARQAFPPRASNDVDGLTAKASNLSIKTPTPAPAPSLPTDVKLTNLPFKAAEQDIRAFFAGFTVKSVTIKRGKGYGFVGLTSNADARRAVGQLDGKKVLDRSVRVQVADPKK